MLFLVLVVGLVGWGWSRLSRANGQHVPLADPSRAPGTEGSWWPWAAFGVVLAVAYLFEGPRLAAFFAGYGVGVTAAFALARPFRAWAARTMGMGSPPS